MDATEVEVNHGPLADLNQLFFHIRRHPTHHPFYSCRVNPAILDQPL